jgi:ABC-type glycerol-3-phosphate transport system substrate-binding protein
MEEFTKAHPDIKVEFKVKSPAEIYQKLPSAITSGVGAPDVCALEGSYVPQIALTGGLLDITGRAQPYLDKFNAFKWADAMKNGRILAMPWDSGPVGVWYRRDIFEKAGYPSDPDSVAKLLDTWDDYYQVAKTIKEKTGAYMFALNGAQNDARVFELLMQQQRLGYFDARGKVVLENPQSIKTLEFLGRMFKEGLTQDTQAWTDPWYAGISEERVATIIEAVWMGGFIKWKADKTGGKWGVVPLPAWVKDRGARTSNNGGSALVVLKQSKQADAAWTFIHFMLARKESQVNMMKQLDCFPSLEEAYNDPFFSQPDPFFADQPYLKLFADLARTIPQWYYTQDYNQANALCSVEIQAYFMGKQDAGTALAKAAANIRLKTRRG